LDSLLGGPERALAVSPWHLRWMRLYSLLSTMAAAKEDVIAVVDNRGAALTRLEA
jgi:hypothetical protein